MSVFEIDAYAKRQNKCDGHFSMHIVAKKKIPNDQATTTPPHHSGPENLKKTREINCIDFKIFFHK